MTLEGKYFKPKSLTWWASVTPLAGGLFMAFDPVHGLVEMSQVVRNISGGASAAVLINIGLAGIGIRGALR
ncbi:hypothetical protein [Aquicoccus sp.]|uniref:hypothetical protein n=1 Tax=Aquicoccus sp. TaxID=2055851 RepID=UPI0035694DA7